MQSCAVAYSWVMTHQVPTLTTFLLPGYSQGMAHQVPTLTTFLLPGYSQGMAHQVPALTTFLLPHRGQHHWFLGLPLTSLSPSPRLPPPTSTGRHSAPARPHTHRAAWDKAALTFPLLLFNDGSHLSLSTAGCTQSATVQFLLWGLPGPSCPLQDQQCLVGHLSRSELGFYPGLLLQCLDSHTTLPPLGVVTTIVFTILLLFRFHYPAPIQLKHYAWFVSFSSSWGQTFFTLNTCANTNNIYIYISIYIYMQIAI